MKRIWLLWVIVVVAVTAPTAAWGQRGRGNPGVIPPCDRYEGLTYGQWVAKWQQTACAIPIVDGHHPFLTGEPFGNEKGIRFLTGLTGGETVNVTIPAGTALFFPLFVAECSNLEPPPFFGANAAEQAAIVNDFIDDVSDLGAEIDGRAVHHPEFYRVQSPQYVLRVPEINILGVPGPATGTSVSAGYFLLLAPLSVGTHTIQFTATYSPFAYTIDTTYVVTVVPRRQNGRAGERERALKKADRSTPKAIPRTRREEKGGRSR